MMAVRAEDRAAHQELRAHGTESHRLVLQRVTLEVGDEVVEEADQAEGCLGAVKALQAEAVGAEVLPDLLEPVLAPGPAVVEAPDVGRG